MDNYITAKDKRILKMNKAIEELGKPTISTYEIRKNELELLRN